MDCTATLQKTLQSFTTKPVLQLTVPQGHPEPSRQSSRAPVFARTLRVGISEALVRTPVLSFVPLQVLPVPEDQGKGHRHSWGPHGVLHGGR